MNPKPGVKNLGAPKPRYDDRIVSFIDILGFSNTIERSDNRNLPSIKSLLDRAFLWSSPKLTDRSLNVLSLSDAVIRARRYGYASFFSEIFVLATIIGWYVSEGYCVRGGVSHGPTYVDSKRNQIVGPALIRAYRLESRCAVYPRVIIDPATLEEYKNNHSMWGHADYDEDAGYVYGCLRKDSDGYYFIDMIRALSSGELLYKKNGRWYDDLPKLVRRQRTLIVKNLANSASPSGHTSNIQEKYMWLKKYHNTSIRELGPKYQRYRI